MPRLRRSSGLVVDDQAGLGRYAPLETGHDQERGAAFDLGIAGIDLDIASAGLGEDRRARFGLPARLGEKGDGHGDQASQGRGMGQL